MRIGLHLDQEVEDRVGSLQARKATVESAIYNVKRLEELQRFEKIYAPYDGVITARNANIGELINAGANAPGRQLFDLASVNRLRVYVNVPQAYARSAKPGRWTSLRSSSARRICSSLPVPRMRSA